MLSVMSYVYNLEKEIAESIGFAVPQNNVLLKKDVEDTNWTYSEKTIKVPAHAIGDYEANKADTDFSIAHEFMHMIQEFILQTNGKYKTFTKEEYEQALNDFFGTTSINVTNEMFEKFKGFIRNSPFKDKEMVDIMLFDDRFYVSPKITAQFEAIPGILNHLYTANTNELQANSFASCFVFEKYKRENQSPELMQDLKTKIDKHLKIMPDKDYIKSEDDFKTQMKVYNLATKKFTKSLGFLPKMAQMRQNYQKQKLDKKLKVTEFSKYNFGKISKITKSQIEGIEQIVTDIKKHYKTQAQIEREQEIIRDAKEVATNVIESLKSPEIVQIVDNFKPSQEDVNKFITHHYDDLTMHEMARKIKDAITFMTQELIVDFQNKVIYNFHTQRNKEMIESDLVLENETIGLPSHENTQIITPNLAISATR